MWFFTSWARSLLLNPKSLSSLQISPGWERFPSSSERLGSHVRQMLQSLGGKKNRGLTQGVWPNHSQMHGTSFGKSGRRLNPSENQVIIIVYRMPPWSFWFKDKNEHLQIFLNHVFLKSGLYNPSDWMERIESTAAEIGHDGLATTIILYQKPYDKWPVRLLVKGGFAFSIWSSNVDNTEKSGNDLSQEQVIHWKYKHIMAFGTTLFLPEFNFFFSGDLL